MSSLFWLIVAFLSQTGGAVAAASCSNKTQSLRTASGKEQAHGLMFDVKAATDLAIRSFDSLLHRRSRETSGYPMEIWTKLGSHVGYETNDSGSSWTRVYSETLPWTQVPATNSGRSLSAAIGFEINPPILMRAGDIRAFYITLANFEEDEAIVVTGKGLESGTLVVQDENLAIFEGTALSSRFAANEQVDPNVVRSGFLTGLAHYETVCIDGAPPLASPPTCAHSETPSNVIRTTDTGQLKAQSIMFDVLAKKTLSVTALHVPVDRDGRRLEHLVQVWTKSGSYKGSEFNPREWNPISAQSLYLRGFTTGFGLFVELPVSTIEITAGTTQAFYVTVLGDGSNQHFLVSPSGAENNALGVDLGGVTVFDSSLQINEGVTLDSFFGGTSTPAIWNGIIDYSLCSSEQANPDVPETAAVCPSEHTQIVATGLETQTRLVEFELEFSIDASVETLLLLFSNLFEGGSFIVSVWTTAGSLATANRDFSTWDIVFRSEVEASFSTVLPKESFIPVTLQAGQRQAFAVGILFVDDEEEDFPLYSGEGLNEIVTMTPNVDIFENGVVLNGALIYSSCTPLRMFSPRCNGQTSITLRTLPRPFDPRRTLGVVGAQGGVMFDVRVEKTVEVTGLDTVFQDLDNLSSSSGVVSVWTKQESYQGFENDQSAWTLVYRHHLLWRRDGNAVEELDRGVFKPVVISAGSTQAFYVTQHADSPLATINVLPARAPLGSPVASDNVMTVFSGLTLAEQFKDINSKVGNYFAGYMEYRQCEGNTLSGISSGLQRSPDAADLVNLSGMKALVGELDESSDPADGPADNNSPVDPEKELHQQSSSGTALLGPIWSLIAIPVALYLV